jgi:HPt (histidine-containing phosphotransfer) domain-containing protein
LLTSRCEEDRTGRREQRSFTHLCGVPGKLVVMPSIWLNGEQVMTAPSVTIADVASSACRTSASDRGQNVLDEDHLARTTLGDRVLEREVLEIFVRQNAVMLARITGAQARLAAVAAHALAGSACGIGAWRLARAAERLERTCNAGSEDELDEAIAELKSASLEAGAAVGARLSDHSLWAVQER